MSELDAKIIKLYTTNSIVNRAFRQTDNEVEALKLAVIAMAERLQTLENLLEEPRRFTWEVNAPLVICPECMEIKRQKAKGVGK